MKKLNFISIILLLLFSVACNIIDSSDQRDASDYQFETNATAYSLQDTINASFTNLSGQTFILHYQVCTIVGLQKWEVGKWESISIPIGCVAVVRDPVKVEPGETYHTGMALGLFDESEFEEGFYRFDLSASRPNEDKRRVLTSNSFKITK